MENKKRYKIIEQFDYHTISVCIVIKDNVEMSSELATHIGETGCSLILNKDGFLVEGVFDEKPYIITDKDINLFKFKVCTKGLPEPLPVEKVNSMSKEELLKVFDDNSPYMITDDDFEERDWSISDVYRILKEKHPNNEAFKWEYVSYIVKEA